MTKEKLYHGSNQIIQHPQLGAGKPHNDYGQGFYCTTDKLMACEWACKKNCDGFVNQYELETTHLQTLNLLDDKYTTLHWIALLLANRTFTLSSNLAQDARQFIIERYLIDTSKYDLIHGYRADDSYFAYAEAFVENNLSIRQLSQALTLGELGTQTVLVSQKAFKQLEFNSAEPVSKTVFYPQFKKRDLLARDTYKTRIRTTTNYQDDVFVLDLMRKG